MAKAFGRAGRQAARNVWQCFVMGEKKTQRNNIIFRESWEWIEAKLSRMKAWSEVSLRIYTWTELTTHIAKMANAWVLTKTMLRGSNPDRSKFFFYLRFFLLRRYTNVSMVYCQKRLSVINCESVQRALSWKSYYILFRYKGTHKFTSDLRSRSAPSREASLPGVKLMATKRGRKVSHVPSSPYFLISFHGHVPSWRCSFSCRTNTLPLASGPSWWWWSKLTS